MEKRLYIIGAGASYEAKLPIGSELIKTIAELLDAENSFSNQEIVNALQRHIEFKTEEYLPYRQAMNKINQAMPLSLSIDNFIHAHNNKSEIELCGKLAIVQAILNAEYSSLLSCNNKQKIEFEKISDTWYVKFFKLLTEDCNKDQLFDRLSTVAFVIFNYDRCFEHFLYQALQTYYDINETESASLINSMDIYHPYGVIGKLPWQTKTTDEDENLIVDYGNIYGNNDLLKLAKNIKTFTEGIDEEASNILAIRKIIETAHDIIFLGFAFHPLNLKLIFSEYTNTNGEIKNILATGYGISLDDITIIANQLGEMLNQTLDYPTDYIQSNATCSKLFDNYRKRLAFI